jgi:LDH2 family malate/lactate/ureidoglycolate dehydrogenase
VRAANAREPVFGTNPICFTAPMAGEEPLCLDMATARVSWNRILMHRRSGTRLAGDWAADARGEPTVDPETAAMLEPIGDYKGYGLGMMVEVLCGLLAGGPIAREIVPMFRAPLGERRRISHCFAAVRLEAFVDPGLFKERLATLAADIRRLPPAPGAAAVMVPGDPEKACFATRSRQGIPIDEERFAEFREIDRAFEGAVRA